MQKLPATALPFFFFFFLRQFPHPPQRQIAQALLEIGNKRERSIITITPFISAGYAAVVPAGVCPSPLTPGGPDAANNTIKDVMTGVVIYTLTC